MFVIKKDTFEFNLDKKSHYCVSFGLYYIFYTYTASMLLSTVLSILVGLLYEVYQGYSEHHSGYSHMDVFYNTVGSLSAALIHWMYL
jgi:hypothetical protein